MGSLVQILTYSMNKHRHKANVHTNDKKLMLPLHDHPIFNLSRTGL